MSFAPAGLITLTTDFGTDQPFAGIMSGRITRLYRDARIFDLSHGMPRGRPDLAGFWLGRAWREFPVGTVHLAVVDPGVGTARDVLLAIAEDQALLAPDNGLLPEALRDSPDPKWLAMSPDLPERLELGPMSRTFHGRDLFAPLAAALASGALHPREFGAPVKPRDPAPLPGPLRDGGIVTGRVLLADRFGNLFTNIGARLVEECRQPVVEAGGRLWPLSTAYGAALPGAPLALVNAFGLLELAVNGGSAAALAGLAEGAPVRLRDGLVA